MPSDPTDQRCPERSERAADAVASEEDELIVVGPPPLLNAAPEVRQAASLIRCHSPCSNLTLGPATIRAPSPSRPRGEHGFIRPSFAASCVKPSHLGSATQVETTGLALVDNKAVRAGSTQHLQGNSPTSVFCQDAEPT